MLQADFWARRSVQREKLNHYEDINLSTFILSVNHVEV